MKRFFLATFLFCGLTPFLSARPRAGNTTAENEKIAIRHKASSKKKTTRFKSSSRKKTLNKRALAAMKRDMSSRHAGHFKSRHHLRKALRFAKIKKGRFSLSARSEAIAAKARNYPALTPDEQKLSNDFENNRGRLTCPVNGSVSLPFGVYTIDNTPNSIKGNNPGITFTTTNKNEPVKAAFDGIVSDVNTKGEVQSICIRHGKYYTVYSNLSAINVKKGEAVQKDQVIAKVGDGYDTDGGELMFMVMINDENVDPAPWLNR